MLYRLSKLIPVMMVSRYTVPDERRREMARWWQYRGRVLWVKRTVLEEW